MESKNNKVIFIIENKIWSGEGDNQLEDYKNYIDEKYSDYNRILHKSTISLSILPIIYLPIISLYCLIITLISNLI